MPTQGLRFEDLHVGLEFESPTRTVTETDVVMFAALTGDYSELHTSEAFAKRMQKHADQGVEGVLFTIGSDLGLDKELVSRADEKLSLGPMTLPHLLARLLLWEQLFRAANMLGGGAYHRVKVQ